MCGHYEPVQLLVHPKAPVRQKVLDVAWILIRTAVDKQCQQWLLCKRDFLENGRKVRHMRNASGTVEGSCSVKHIYRPGAGKLVAQCSLSVVRSLLELNLVDAQLWLRLRLL